MRLNQVLILSQDVERAVTFYEALGLRRLAVNFPCDARLLCPDSAEDGAQAAGTPTDTTTGTTLAIEHTAQMPVRPNATVYFQCTDIDRTVARLRARGIVFDSGPIDEPWRWREARLRDPDGNPIVLYSVDGTRKAEPGLDPSWHLRKTDNVHA